MRIGQSGYPVVIDGTSPFYTLGRYLLMGAVATLLILAFWVYWDFCYTPSKWSEDYDRRQMIRESYSR